MSFLKRTIKNAVSQGISRGVGNAIGKAVQQVVEPRATEYANKAAEHFDQAAIPLKSVYTNHENSVCIYTSQNAKIPTLDPPVWRGKTVGIFKCRIHRTGRNSCVMHRCGDAIFRSAASQQ